MHSNKVVMLVSLIFNLAFVTTKDMPSSLDYKRGDCNFSNSSLSKFTKFSEPTSRFLQFSEPFIIIWLINKLSQGILLHTPSPKYIWFEMPPGRQCYEYNFANITGIRISIFQFHGNINPLENATGQQYCLNLRDPLKSYTHNSP